MHVALWCDGVGDAYSSSPSYASREHHQSGCSHNNTNMTGTHVILFGDASVKYFPCRRRRLLCRITTCLFFCCCTLCFWLILFGLVDSKGMFFSMTSLPLPEEPVCNLGEPLHCLLLLLLLLKFLSCLVLRGFFAESLYIRAMLLLSRMRLRMSKKYKKRTSDNDKNVPLTMHSSSSYCSCNRTRLVCRRSFFPLLLLPLLLQIHHQTATTAAIATTHSHLASSSSSSSCLGMQQQQQHFLGGRKSSRQQIDASAKAAEADGFVYSRIVFKPLLAASFAAVQLEFVYITARHGAAASSDVGCTVQFLMAQLGGGSIK